MEREEVEKTIELNNKDIENLIKEGGKLKNRLKSLKSCTINVGGSDQNLFALNLFFYHLNCHSPLEELSIHSLKIYSNTQTNFFELISKLKKITLTKATFTNDILNTFFHALNNNLFLEELSIHFLKKNYSNVNNDLFELINKLKRITLTNITFKNENIERSFSINLNEKKLTINNTHITDNMISKIIPNDIEYLSLDNVIIFFHRKNYNKKKLASLKELKIKKIIFSDDNLAFNNIEPLFNIISAPNLKYLYIESLLIHLETIKLLKDFIDLKKLSIKDIIKLGNQQQIISGFLDLLKKNIGLLFITDNESIYEKLRTNHSVSFWKRIILSKSKETEKNETQKNTDFFSNSLLRQKKKNEPGSIENFVKGRKNNDTEDNKKINPKK